MNGVGWVCDECGKTEVLGDLPSGHPFMSPPPDGWYLLFKGEPDPARANQRWEFCSVQCIHAQTSAPPENVPEYVDWLRSWTVSGVPL